MLLALRSSSTLVSARLHSSGWVPSNRFDTTNRQAAGTASPSTAENHRRGHRHPGSVHVYVTQGTVRLGVEACPVQVVKTGGSFFEAVGGHHIITENASATEPARAIAVMIVPEGAPLTTPDEGK